MKKYLFAAMALFLAVGFVGCDKDDDEKDPDPTPTPTPIVSNYKNLDVEYTFFLDTYPLDYGTMKVSLTDSTGNVIETKTVSKSTEGTKITRDNLINEWCTTSIDMDRINNLDSKFPGIFDKLKQYTLKYKVSNPNVDAYYVRVKYDVNDGVTLPQDTTVNYGFGFHTLSCATDKNNQVDTLRSKKIFVFANGVKCPQLFTVGMQTFAKKMSTQVANLKNK